MSTPATSTESVPSPIIIIGGPPGSGKSTVAKELINLLGSRVVYIEGDTFWKFIVKSGNLQGKQKNGFMIIRSMGLAAIPYARSGYEVIIDFSIGPWHLDPMLPHFKELPVHYFILCPNADVCAKRAANRTEGAMPDYGPYLDLHTAFCDIKSFEQHAIRKDDADPVSLAKEIKAGIEAGTFCLKNATPGDSTERKRTRGKHHGE